MGLVVGWFALIHLENGRNVYRINIVFFASLLLYMVFTGGEEGEKFLLMYTCPLILFFLLGKKEGLFWSVFLILLAVIILWNPFSFSGAY
jgi:two-component system sensor histidine kinase/response regulator